MNKRVTTSIKVKGLRDKIQIYYKDESVQDLSKFKANDKVPVKVLRAGKELTLTITLGSPR